VLAVGCRRTHQRLPQVVYRGDGRRTGLLALLVRLITWLPWSIEQQLQRDSNPGMVEYQVLAMLSESPQRTLRMSSLAELTNASLSRLSHLVKRLERRGLV
jgi:DNA-binding MarR family transcriptional regulator